LFPTLQAVDELVDAFLIKVRLALLLQSSRYEIRRPTAFQELKDLLLENGSLDYIAYLTSLGFPLGCLSLCSIGKILSQLEVLVPS